MKKPDITHIYKFPLLSSARVWFNVLCSYKDLQSSLDCAEFCWRVVSISFGRV